MNIKYRDISIKQGEILGVISDDNSIFSDVNSFRFDDNYKSKRRVKVIKKFSFKRFNVKDTVYNNFVRLNRKYRLSAFDIEKKIVELRDVFELDVILNKRVNELNNLEFMKVYIANLLIGNPEILVINKLFKNVYLVEKVIILKCLKRCNKELKTTIVLISDDFMDIEKICKRVICFKGNKVVDDNNLDNFKSKVGNEKIVSILFNKSFNCVKGDFEIIDASDYSFVVKVDFNKYSLMSLINEFDVNTIVDISVSSVSCLEMLSKCEDKSN